MNRISHSYFVVMVNRTQGLEAIVNPEETRRDIISNIAAKGYGHPDQIEFIQHIEGLYVEDVTDELLNEAQALALQAAE